jgi:hypothetical protein
MRCLICAWTLWERRIAGVAPSKSSGVEPPPTWPSNARPVEDLREPQVGRWESEPGTDPWRVLISAIIGQQRRIRLFSSRDHPCWSSSISIVLAAGTPVRCLLNSTEEYP